MEGERNNITPLSYRFGNCWKEFVPKGTPGKNNNCLQKRLLPMHRNVQETHIDKSWSRSYKSIFFSCRGNNFLFSDDKNKSGICDKQNAPGNALICLPCILSGQEYGMMKQKARNPEHTKADSFNGNKHIRKTAIKGRSKPQVFLCVCLCVYAVILMIIRIPDGFFLFFSFFPSSDQTESQMFKKSSCTLMYRKNIFSGRKGSTSGRDPF